MARDPPYESRWNSGGSRAEQACTTPSYTPRTLRTSVDLSISISAVWTDWFGENMCCVTWFGMYGESLPVRHSG